MVNRVILIGNLGKEPEIRRLENGAVVAKFSLATNENYRDKNGGWQTSTEWHDIVVWRALAERAEATLKKGALVYIEGKLTHRTWQDQDGNSRRTTEVVASYFRNLGKREDMGSGDSSSSDDETPASPYHGEPTSPVGIAADTASDDLPF